MDSDTVLLATLWVTAGVFVGGVVTPLIVARKRVAADTPAKAEEHRRVRQDQCGRPEGARLALVLTNERPRQRLALGVAALRVVAEHGKNREHA